MQISVLSIGDKSTGTAKTTQICCPFINKMLCFILGVSGNKDLIIFVSQFMNPLSSIQRYTLLCPLSLHYELCSSDMERF